MKKTINAINVIVGALIAISSPIVSANSSSKEYLVRLHHGVINNSALMTQFAKEVGTPEVLLGDWVKIIDRDGSIDLAALKAQSQWIDYVQPNYPVKLIEDYKAKDAETLAKGFIAFGGNGSGEKQRPDNLPIPAEPQPSFGEDPLFSKQWGMIDNHVKEAWALTQFMAPLAPKAPMVVAVLDSGVDYTHEDLLPNMWRNPGETGLDSQGRDKQANGVDDDNNGYVDDVVGWDFVMNDNKPYDLYKEGLELLMGGGNPGHGTHCAGNVAAAAGNGKGIAGVAPNVKIMALRFLSEKGGGTSADAIKAIKYAVDNGALITSNSWGSEGEDPNEKQENQALRDAITYAKDKGVLFIAAAGNGHQGVGYDNDSDPQPGYPASYDHDNIISVAALDDHDQLGGFSNWGLKTVDLGAPGVKVFSTVPSSQKYSDTVIDKMGITAFWDGTSMATPHVSGAAALYWSAHPELQWNQVRDAVLKSVKPIPALNGKTTTGGKLDVLNLMRQN